jgi:hypothetical protein
MRMPASFPHLLYRVSWLFVEFPSRNAFGDLCFFFKTMHRRCT